MVETKITSEMVEAVRKAILIGLEESHPDHYSNPSSYSSKITIDGEFDLRLVVVRALEALEGYRDLDSLADIYIKDDLTEKFD